MAEKYINISTPHISVKDESFSKTVLMPGDPMRAEKIAKEFLSEVKIISDIRGIKAYKGKYLDSDVTIMASGMGMPSIGLYSHELFNFFGVENIIRVGSIGAVRRDLNLGDIVIAQAASTNSNYLRQYGLDSYNYSPISDYKILNLLNVETSQMIEQDKKVLVGNILSSDTFYFSSARTPRRNLLIWAGMNCFLPKI